MQTPATDDLVWYLEGSAVPLAKGAALANGATYYAGLGGNDALVTDAQFKWTDVALIAAITFESCNFPDATIQQAAGSDWAAEAAIPTVNIPGGSAATASRHITGNGAQRLRAKLAVTTGIANNKSFRGRVHHKK
jgi:hypothetical protein